VAKARQRWALWAERDGDTILFYDRPVPIPSRPPKEAERSEDGNWATLYAEGEPVRTWMRLMPLRHNNGRSKA
jgi:hypothetical protein